IPALLVIHFVGVRMIPPLFGKTPLYANALNAYWVQRPWQEWVQFTLLLVAWTHGCIGLYFWLRMKRHFVRAASFLVAFAVLPPSYREEYVLDRVGVRADPAIRLACQLRPDTDLAFLLLLPPQLNLSFVRERKKARIGEERFLVSMFVDLRGSTRLAERGLPY